jgi:hypothetical protein
MVATGNRLRRGFGRAAAALALILIIPAVLVTAIYEFAPPPEGADRSGGYLVIGLSVGASIAAYGLLRLIGWVASGFSNEP